jgi:hybrid cluster-associated redox disulfide protein
MPITAELMVDDVMRRWPATIAVFAHHRMLCIGCVVGPYHRVDEACAEHDIDLARFLADLNRAASAIAR